MPRLSFYNREAVAVITDGITSTKLGDEFAISIEFPDNSATVTVGLQEAVTNFNSDKTATATVNALPQSPFNDQMLNLYYLQARGQGREFDLTLYTGVNEKHECKRCSLRQTGTMRTGGPEGEPREYVLNVAEFVPDKSGFV